MKMRGWIWLLAGLTALTARGADDTSEGIDSLRQQIRELEQKILVIERNQELREEAATTKAKEAPKISVGDSGLKVSSGDTNFVFQLRGLVQVDNRTFFNDGGSAGNDTFLLRRARPIFQGTLHRDFDFLFVPDFAGSSAQIIDAYLNYRYSPALQLRVGKMKSPVGLEYLQSDPVTSFPERSLVTALVPGRDIGFQLWGDLWKGRLNYAAGVFNGVADGRNTSNSDFEDHRDFEGRVFLQPFKQSESRHLNGLGFGLGGSWGTVSSSSAGIGPYQTDAQAVFFAYTNGVVADGDRWRLSPQAYYYNGPFHLLAEYAVSSHPVRRGALARDLQHSAWQVSAGWVLTGENASFSGVTPEHAFNPALGRWGAFQLVARYAELDLDDDAFPDFADPAANPSGAQAWGVGLNWYLNKNLRASASYMRTTFDGGGSGSSASALTTRKSEEVLITRLQLSF